MPLGFETPDSEFGGSNAWELTAGRHLRRGGRRARFPHAEPAWAAASRAEAGLTWLKTTQINIKQETNTKKQKNRNIKRSRPDLSPSSPTREKRLKTPYVRRMPFFRRTLSNAPSSMPLLACRRKYEGSRDRQNTWIYGQLSRLQSGQLGRAPEIFGLSEGVLK
jgi:hypothetical protein